MALKPFNSIGGFSVGETPSNVILANGDITTTNITTTGIANLNAIGNVKISGGTAGQVLSTDGAGNLTFVTTATSGSIFNGTSNVAIPVANGNVIAAVAGTTILTITTAGANLVGNLSVGGILTDNIYHANGAPFDLQQAAGSNTQIQYNMGNNFAASANFTFNDATNVFTVNGNANVGNLGTAQVLASANVTAPQLISNVANGTAPFVVTSTTQVANLSVATAGSATTAGTVTTAAQPNITSVGNLTGLTVGNASSNVVIADTGTIVATGNITAPNFIGNVQGNISGNIVAPGSNTEVVFNNAGNLGASNAFSFNNSSNVLTVVGNVSATNFIGNGAALTAIAGANVTGQVGNALVAGTVYTNAQPNITSVGTLTSLAVTGNISSGNVSATSANLTTANVTGNVIIGSTTVTSGTVTTTATTANQTIASFAVTGTTGIEYLVKGIDSAGGKHSVAKVVAVTDGANVDYTIFATVNIGTVTGSSLQVVVDSGNLKLQVTPASSNSTVWTTQYNLV